MGSFLLSTPAIHYLPDGGEREKKKMRLCTDDLFSSLLHLVPNAPADSPRSTQPCTNTHTHTHTHTHTQHTHTHTHTLMLPYIHIYYSNTLQSSHSFRHTGALTQVLKLIYCKGPVHEFSPLILLLELI